MKILVVVIGSLLLTLSTPFASANMPGYYPPFFPYSGVVNQVNKAEGYIVVSDAMFRFSENVRFHTPESGFEPMSRLAKGQTVGVRFIKDRKGRYIVTNIWLLPEKSIGLPVPR